MQKFKSSKIRRCKNSKVQKFKNAAVQKFENNVLFIYGGIDETSYHGKTHENSITEMLHNSLMIDKQKHKWIRRLGKPVRYKIKQELGKYIVQRKTYEKFKCIQKV